MQDLLQDLRDRSRNHRSVSLEETAHDAQYAHDEDRRCQRTDRIYGFRHLHDFPGEELSAGRHDDSGNESEKSAEEKTHPEDLPDVSVLLLRVLCRDQLGYGLRKAVSRDHQQDVVDAVSRAVNAHAVFSDDGEHGDAEQHADDAADDPGDRKDASLYDEIVFPLFGHVSPG